MYNIHDWCMLRSEEEVRSSEIGIYCDPPCGFYILNQCPLQKQQVFLTIEAHLQDLEYKNFKAFTNQSLNFIPICFYVFLSSIILIGSDKGNILIKI